MNIKGGHAACVVLKEERGANALPRQAGTGALFGATLISTLIETGQIEYAEMWLQVANTIANLLGSGPT